LPAARLCATIELVSTVAEIERAIDELPTEQMLVAAWLDERRAMLSASGAMFLQLDQAEDGGGDQWLGE
jgi:hypothetical protein